VRARFLIVMGALIAAVALSIWQGSRSDVGLGSIRQLWSDVLRDADRPALRLTRLSVAEETQLGDNLMAGMPWAEDPAAAIDVTAVARAMLPHVRRRGIGYRFHVARTPMINAFALPGGHVIVTTGMLGFVQSNAELAEAIGHEIAHVDLHHAAERHQLQYRLGPLLELFHRLAAMPYTADQELDADAEGLRLSSAAGYDPAAAPVLFTRLQQLEGPGRPPAVTPAGELGQSVEGAVASYFRSHPPSAERARRLEKLARKTARLHENAR
jgi:predicted Zn-dependent protease